MKSALHLTLFLAGLLVLACSETKPGIKAKFIIVNQTGSDIDSLRIDPDNENRTIRLKKSDSVYYYSNMTGLPKVDGAYCLRFRKLSSQKTQIFSFGYYTNGGPLEDSTRVTIFADTIFTKQYYGSY